MFIVIPYLTSQPSIYGIYSICISVSIFLAYADLGFLGAGQKYAAEHYARGEKKEEISVIGFTCFILSLFLLIFSITFLYLSFCPNILIKKLLPGQETYVASSLFLILAIFTPTTLLQRLLQMIFGIRVEDYIIQRTNVIANIVKIASVLWFFRINKYNIVGYYLFVQIINFVSAVITLIIGKIRYNYNFIAIISSIHFNKTIFLKTKNLAFTSLYLTFAWILYYELDTTTIGKFIGANEVAIYAIGLTLLSFFRSLFGILFSPFNSRFNHFVGLNDVVGLRIFYLQVISILAPIILIPIITVAILIKPLILTWVGNDYYNSIEIARMLVLCNVLAFISYPASMLLMAQERIKELYLVNSLIPIIYWVGIILTYSYLGLKSYSIFKLVAFGISAIIYYFTMIKFLGMNILDSLSEIFKPLVIPLIFSILISLFIRNYLPIEKSKQHLFFVTVVILIIIGISFFIQLLTSNRIRQYIIGLIRGNLINNNSTVNF